MGRGQLMPPSNTPLGCLLKSLKDTGLEMDLKSKRLIFFCNTAWPHYKLDNGSIWPENRTLDPQILTDLDNYCQCLGKWSKVPYIQAFSELCPSICQTCPTYQILLHCAHLSSICLFLAPQKKPLLVPLRTLFPSLCIPGLQTMNPLPLLTAPQILHLPPLAGPGPADLSLHP